MAINVYAGVMGSGKSYEVVSGPILDAVASGRRVVTNVDGISEDRIREYLKKKRKLSDEQVGSVVHVTNDRVREPGFFPVERTVDGVTTIENGIVQCGDLVAIDEAWRMWGQDCGALSPEHMSFFRMHRHFTHPETGVACDVVLMIQDIGGLHRSLRAVVELSFRMHKLKSLGFSKKYRVEMFEGYKQNKKTRVSYFLKTYRAEIFPLYQSYSGGVGTEAKVDSRQNVFSRGKLWVMAGVFVAIWVIGGAYLWRFFHRSADSHGALGATATLAHGAVSGATGASAVPPRPLVSPWRIAGRYSSDGVLYVVLADASGRFRVQPFDGFSGNGVLVSGAVDGQRASYWSGTLPGTSAGAK